MITSKLTSKAQTTIPQPVRTALRLKDGDELAYEIEENRVILAKADAGTIDDPFATFGEWMAKRTGKLMPSFKQGDVIRVPFPYPIDRRGSTGRRSSSPKAESAKGTVCFGSP